MLLLALLLYRAPYSGIQHDATLYLVQALRLQQPLHFANDLFFIAGSQGDYTAFPEALAAVLGFADAGHVFLYGTLLGRIAFGLGTFFLARKLWVNQIQAIIATAAVLLLPPIYGAFGIFRYGEPFLTARPFAEGLSLAALAVTLTGYPHRNIGAFLLLGIAFILHPLQALAAGLVVWFLLFSDDKRWLIALLLPFVAAILGLLGIRPFSGLFIIVDPAWLSRLLEVNTHCFVLHWKPIDAILATLDIFFLAVAGHAATPPLRRLLRATLFASAAGLLISIVFGDLLKSSLIIGLQPWRVLWITHWLAMASLPFTLHHYWNSERFRALLLAIIALFASRTAGNTGPYAALICGLLFLFWPSIASKTRPALRRTIFAALALGIAISVGIAFQRVLDAFHANDMDVSRFRIDTVLLGIPLLAWVMLCAFSWLLIRLSPRALWGVAVFALAGSAWLWDSRSTWSKTIEAANAEQSAFGVHLPDNAQIYWYENPTILVPWLVLQRSSYFSNNQMAGQVFNRGTAMLAQAREEAVKPLFVQAEICRSMQSLTGQTGDCNPTAESVLDLCAVQSTAPPTHIVLPYSVALPEMGHWNLKPLSKNERATKTYYLYDCSTALAENNRNT